MFGGWGGGGGHIRERCCTWGPRGDSRPPPKPSAAPYQGDTGAEEPERRSRAAHEGPSPPPRATPHPNSASLGVPPPDPPPIYPDAAFAGPSTPRSSRLLFRFAQELRGNAEVLQAHLHLFWTPPGPGGSQPVSVRLLLGDAAQNGTALSEALLEAHGDGWAALDVSDALRSALSRGTEQLTVELSTARPPMPTYGDTHRPFVAVRARSRPPPPAVAEASIAAGPRGCAAAKSSSWTSGRSAGRIGSSNRRGIT